MIRTVHEIRARLEQVFQRAGADPDEAVLLADVLVEAELRGRSTHGLNRAAGLVKMLHTRPPGRPAVIEERGPLVRIDGQDQSGYLTADFMVQQAIRVANQHGHALVGARNTRHCGMLGYYTSRAARAGLIALLLADCAPFVAPWGGAEKVLGTNPLSAAFPADPHPVLIDMATAAITYGDLDRARREGRALPEGVAVDAAGRPTREPADVAALLPFGEHRGYALGLLVQLLAGVCVGAAAVPPSHSDYGLLLLTMKPDLFAPAGHYRSGLDELLRRIRTAKPATPGIQVLAPGDRAFAERARRLETGVQVSAQQWDEITSLLA